MALKRLQHEYSRITRETPEFVIYAGPKDADDYFKWSASIRGPLGTPYEDAIFSLDIDFSTEYPFKPPKIRFTTEVFHPNISPMGHVCADIFQVEQWSPALTVPNVLLSVISLLASPNTDDPLNAEAAKLYLEDYGQYKLKAKKYINLQQSCSA